jgi:hypothetical protein
LLTPLAVAVIVAVCVVLTAEIVAVNAALVAPAGTVTDAGTVTAELLLAKATVNPPLGAAAVRPTVQASVPAPVTEPLLQETALSAAVGADGFSCSEVAWLTPLAVAVIVAVCVVLTAEAAAVNAALVAPAGTVTDAGTLTAELVLASATAKPPVGTIVEIATAQASDPAPVSDPLPHEIPLNTGARGAVGFSWMLNVALPLCVFAVIVTVVAAVTAAMLAVKVMLVVPRGKSSEEGTCTAGLLLESFMLRPFAALTTPLIETVHVSVPAPLNDELAHEKLLIVTAAWDGRAASVAPNKSSRIAAAWNCILRSFRNWREARSSAGGRTDASLAAARRPKGGGR